MISKASLDIIVQCQCEIFPSSRVERLSVGYKSGRIGGVDGEG